MGSELHLASAEATYWSSTPVGVSDSDIATAWTAATSDVWKDEVHITVEDGHTRAAFLFNSGQVRMSVCECVLVVGPVWTTAHFLTAVMEEAYGLNLGWALHTRTLDAVTDGNWSNPYFGEAAVRYWTEREQLRQRAHVDPAQLEAVYVDRVNRFALELDRASGRTFVSIPVSNTKVDYTEWYAIDRATFDRFRADPTLAHGFLDQARNRELDHLLLFQPGTDRGVP
jgi:hypothetical protein